MTIGRAAQATAVHSGSAAVAESRWMVQGIQARSDVRLDSRERKANIEPRLGKLPMSSDPQAKIAEDDLDAAIDQAIATCDGDLRATIGALIVANDFLESEVSELMKAVSHAYARGRFQSYSG
jgi:hypothetical protein